MKQTMEMPKKRRQAGKADVKLVTVPTKKELAAERGVQKAKKQVEKAIRLKKAEDQKRAMTIVDDRVPTDPNKKVKAWVYAPKITFINGDPNIFEAISVRGAARPYALKQFLSSPYFALTPTTVPFTYTSPDGVEEFTITPGTDIGPDGKAIIISRPTVYDRDFILYCIAHIQGMLQREEITAKTANFPMFFDFNDVMINLHRPTARLTKTNAVLEGIRAAGRRLAGAMVTTEIKFGNRVIIDPQHFVSTFRVDADYDTGKIGLVIKLGDWIYNSIVDENLTVALVIDHEYFKLPQGLMRRIYDLVRQQAGIWPKAKAGCCIPLEALRIYCGSQSTGDIWRTQVKAVVDEITASKLRKKPTDKTYPQFREWTLKIVGKNLEVVNFGVLKRTKNRKALGVKNAQVAAQ
jgi:hypothetical protein